MHAFKLTERGFWEEISFLDIPARGKDLLRNAVHAHVHDVVPQVAMPRDVRSLSVLGPIFIELCDSPAGGLRRTQLLELVCHVPHDRQKTRMFFYLRRTYGDSGSAMSPLRAISDGFVAA
jgi:hypothetical protein